MKKERTFPRFTVNQKAERSLRAGHPWVYGEEVTDRAPVENGAIADVFSEKGVYLGSGFVNGNSKILVRVLSKNANDTFDEGFFRRRIRYALDYRHTVMGADFSACRLIFGEADGLPGWTVDRFEGVLVSEVLSLGIEQRKEMLYRLLLEELQRDGVQIDHIYERNESPLREKEGLAQGKGFVRLPGLSAEGDGFVEIVENGIRYEVDYINGQKTGFFLDQKYNRLAVARLAKGRRVLDCFTHTGSFALNAARGGAEHVTAVDVSASAIEMARENASFIKTEARRLGLKEKGGAPYDFIILDPPAFTKSRKTVGSAERGYKEINLRALQLLPRGAYLATASCSHFMRSDLFVKMLRSAAADAGVELRQIEARQQAPDHPILWNVPETDYLKFYLFQVV